MHSAVGLHLWATRLIPITIRSHSSHRTSGICVVVGMYYICGSFNLKSISCLDTSRKLVRTSCADLRELKGTKSLLGGLLIWKKKDVGMLVYMYIHIYTSRNWCVHIHECTCMHAYIYMKICTYDAHTMLWCKFNTCFRDQAFAHAISRARARARETERAWA